METVTSHQDTSTEQGNGNREGEEWLDGAEPAAGASGGAAGTVLATVAHGRPNGGSVQPLMAGPLEIENFHARDHEPEELLSERVASLPALWMRRYVTALFELRGSPFQARKRVAQQGGAISAGSVDRAAAKNPTFAALIEEAIRNRDEELVDCVWKGGALGDEHPVFQQGVQVGTRTLRSPKDAELYMKYRGMISDDPGPRASVRVTISTGDQAPSRTAAVAAALFAARAAQPPLLDAATGQRLA